MFLKIFNLFLFLSINIFSNAQDCYLEVPLDPLNTGLFKPWFLSTNPISDVNCTQTEGGTEVFVESTILDLNTGKFYVYNPLVVDKGTQPVIMPQVVLLPVNNTVIINVGANGNSVTLLSNGNSFPVGNCVNGISNGSIFGQVAYCNGKNFFKTVNDLIAQGKVVIPPIQNTLLGDQCPTTRNFGVVDQDQSDNVITQYILTLDGKVAQDTPFNRNSIPNISKILSNGSDNRLLSDFILAAVGCKPFTAPDLVDNNIMKSSQSLNEIQANLLPYTDPAVALTPAIDPMVLDNGNKSLIKVNLYRQGVNQPPLDSLKIENDLIYCNNLNVYGISFLILHRNEFTNFMSVNNQASNLLNFLSSRFMSTWNILNCINFIGVTSPITITINENTGQVISNNIEILNQIRNPTVPTNPSSMFPTNPVSTVVPTNPSSMFPTNPVSTVVPTNPSSMFPTNPVSTVVPTNPSSMFPTNPVSTVFPSTYINLCGTNYNNVNCAEPCPNGLDTECKTLNFKCFKVTNDLNNCNYNNFCGLDYNNINCLEKCPNGLDIDCKTPNYKCFKNTICNNLNPTSIIPPSITTTTLNNIVNYTYLCGTNNTNVNCTETCFNGLDTECKTPNYKCFKIYNSTSICNYNTFCGLNINNIRCSEPCPKKLDTDCRSPNFKCFKNNFCKVTNVTNLLNVPIPNNSKTNKTNKIYINIFFIFFLILFSFENVN